MIDTIILSLDTEISTSFFSGHDANVPFTSDIVPGFTCRILTTKPGSPYHKIDRRRYYLQLNDYDKGISLQGPINYDRGVWECRTCRIELRQLLGLPPGFLLADQSDLDAAITALRIALSWLPAGDLESAVVSDIHLTMNFNLTDVMSADDTIAAHALVRHSRVRKDPFKFKPEHSTLNWKGTNLFIAMYEKTQQVASKIAAEKMLSLSEFRKRYNFHEMIRLEFRVKKPLLTKLFDKITPPAPVDGLPPLPPNPSPVRLAALNENNITAIFRVLVWEFGNPPIPTIKRLSTRKFLAMLIREGAVLKDGTPVIEFAARYMSHDLITRAKGDARKIDTGSPRFNWCDILGPQGFGPYAVPKPEQYRTLE